MPDGICDACRSRTGPGSAGGAIECSARYHRERLLIVRKFTTKTLQDVYQMIRRTINALSKWTAANLEIDASPNSFAIKTLTVEISGLDYSHSTFCTGVIRSVWMTEICNNSSFANAAAALAAYLCHASFLCESA